MRKPKFTESRDGQRRCTLRAEARVDEEWYAKLEKWAAKQGCTVAELAVRALDAGLFGYLEDQNSDEREEDYQRRHQLTMNHLNGDER